MTIDVSPIRDFAELEALAQPWRELAASGGPGGLFRGPDWLLAWWRAYHQVLHAELFVLAAREGDQLVGLAPLYTRVARRGPGFKVREIRLLGDAGPRPPALDFLFRPGYEDRVGAAWAKHLDACSDDWDVIELEPLRDPSRGRGVLVSRLGNSDYGVRTSHAAGGALRIALGVAGNEVPDEGDSEVVTHYDDVDALRKGLSSLRRLSRLEWAHREESSPLADREAYQLLEEVTLRLGSQHHAHLTRLDDASGEAIAIALVVDDGERAVVLALAVDPQHEEHAPARILTDEARTATERGRAGLDVVPGAVEHGMPSLPTTRQRPVSLQIYSSSTAAAMARTYGAVRQRVEAAREARGTAAAPVAGYSRMHLYRGELWTRGIAPPENLVLGTLSQDEFDALDETARGEMVKLLHLDEDYCRQKWQRGDIVVLARLQGRPAGIAWCARGAVRVPELDRELHLSADAAYIHDVFVAAAARGRAVAPAMLEHLSGILRQRDVYRSWALIGSDNTASVRAFEKAAYTAVADVVYAHIATVDHIMVRPPDPEAKQLLGLS